MDETMLVPFLGVFLIVMILSGMIFLRFRTGRADAESDLDRAYRRNNFVVAFIIVIFLFIFFAPLLDGSLEEHGIVGWRKVATGVTVLIGLASVVLLLIGSMRKRKR